MQYNSYSTHYKEAGKPHQSPSLQKGWYADTLSQDATPPYKSCLASVL